MPRAPAPGRRLAETAKKDDAEEGRQEGREEEGRPGWRALASSKAAGASSQQASASAGGRAVGGVAGWSTPRAAVNTAAEVVAVKIGTAGHRRVQEGHRLSHITRAPDHWASRPSPRRSAIISFTANRLVRRKLRLSIAALRRLPRRSTSRCSLYPALVAGRRRRPGPVASSSSRSPPALINLVVVGIINPLRADRVPERFPSILQDAIVIGLLRCRRDLLFSDKLLTTSAVSAVVVGFALQDTLGNAFAGLAIQSEKPFRVGALDQVGEFEGRVPRSRGARRSCGPRPATSSSCRTTSSPRKRSPTTPSRSSPTRLEVEVGASYLSTPGDVKAAMLEAMRKCPRVLPAPAPDVLLHAFDASAITYRARFWIDRLRAGRARAGRGADGDLLRVRAARHRDPVADPGRVRARMAGAGSPRRSSGSAKPCSSGVDLFAALTPEQRREIAPATSTRRSSATARRSSGRARKGSRCSSCARARVTVVLEPDRRRSGDDRRRRLFRRDVAADRRAANGDGPGRGRHHRPRARARMCSGRLGAADPRAVEQIGIAAVDAAGRARTRPATAARSGAGEVPATLLARMKRFLGLD